MNNYMFASPARKIAALALYVGTALVFVFSFGISPYELWATLAALRPTTLPVLAAVLVILGLGLGYYYATGKRTMTTKEALEKSIVHWEENLERAKIGMLYAHQIESDECPLCGMFVYGTPDSTAICAGCPVYRRTGLDACTDTPWERVADAITGRRESAIIVTAVQDELDFLKSLRKE